MKRLLAVAVAAFVLTGACKGEAGPPMPTGRKPSTTTPSSATAPTLSASGSPTTVGGAHPFGLKWNWGQIDALRGYLTRTGGGATFFLLTWCDIEPRPGERDWTEVDRVVKDARQLGYEMYLKIRVGSCWATGGASGEGVGTRGLTASLMPSDLAAYSQFVDAAVQRYAPQGVHTWGIENEVNARNFWRGTPEEYRQLAVAVATTIHRSDSQARVLDSGLSSIAYGALLARSLLERGDERGALAQYQRYYARRFANARFVYPRADSVDELRDALDSEVATRGREFMDATVELTRTKVVDGFQLHYYDPVEMLPSVLGHISDRVGPAVAIEAWETGVAWPGKDYDAHAHAAETVKLLAGMLAGGVKRSMYLPAAFTPGGARESELVRGLVEPNGRVRPAGAAYALLIDAAAGNRGWRTVSAGRLEGIAFDKGASTVLVLWSDGASTLPALPGARVTSLTGATIDPAGGARIGADPVFVTGVGGIDAALSALSAAG